MELQGLIGTTVGNWRMTRQLGEGAFGAVFEAEHVAIQGRKGAVKILRPELSMQAQMKQRFLNEASAASRAEHENIVQIFDGGITPDGTCYQVMEMLSGAVLTQVMKRSGRLDVGRTINLAAQIAAALQAAHNIQIVHRDLKPDNVFVVERTTNPEFVKVLDFGVAKLRGDPTKTDDKLTGTGMIIGTAPYMAPEQWQSRPDIDGRADIYALGVMMFEMLCGQRPYAANNAYEWIVLHMEATPPELTPFGVPQQLARIVRRMLAREPAQRQQTMREVIQDLRVAARGVKGIAAFASEAVALPGPNAATEIAPPPPGQPPPQSYQPAPQSYQPPPQSYIQSQPGYASQPGYPQQTGYQQQPAYQTSQPYASAQGGYAMQPHPGYGQPSYQPPPYQPPPAPPVNRGPMWRKLGEFALGAAIIGIYLFFYWAETVAWFKNFLHTLKPPTI